MFALKSSVRIAVIYLFRFIFIILKVLLDRAQSTNHFCDRRPSLASWMNILRVEHALSSCTAESRTSPQWQKRTSSALLQKRIYGCDVQEDWVLSCLSLSSMEIGSLHYLGQSVFRGQMHEFEHPSYWALEPMKTTILKNHPSQDYLLLIRSFFLWL